MAEIRAVIVDDEELARHLVSEYLREEKDIEIVAECSNGFEGVRAAHELKPHLMFLDVQMPKLNGFEVLDLIDPEIAVIFVTAYDQYAMKAFDAAAVDYLLKPFSLDRFRAALDRARRRIVEAQKMPEPAELYAAAVAPGKFAQRIVVKDGARIHIIPVEKLDYAETQDDYVALHSDKKTWLKPISMASLEATLDPSRFVRVHRSHLLNVEKIVKIEPYTKDTRLAVLADGTQVPISRAGYARLKELMSID